MLSPAFQFFFTCLLFCNYSISQCAYYTDSLTKALQKEKLPLKRCLILAQLSEEWRERDKEVADKYYDQLNRESAKGLKPAEVCELLLKRSFLDSKFKGFKQMKHNIDSASGFALSSGNSNLHGLYYLNLSLWQSQTSDEQIDADTALLNAGRGLKLLQNDLLEKARAQYIYVTIFANTQKNMLEMDKHLNEFEKTIALLPDARLKAKYYTQVGKIHHDFTHRESKSVSSNLQALKNYYLAHDSLGISELMVNTAGTELYYGSAIKGLEMVQRGIGMSLRNAFLNKKRTNENISGAYVVLAIFHFKQKDTAECIDSYRKAIYFNNLAGKFYNEALISGDLAVTYGNFKMLDSALAVEKRTMALRRKFRINEGILFSYGHMAHLAYQQKQYDSAIAYANKSLEIANKIKIHVHDKNAYTALFETYEKLNNFEKAYYYYRKFVESRDSLQALRNSNEAQRVISKNKEELNKAEFERQQALSDLELQRNRFLVDQKEKELKILDQENNIKAYSLEKSKSVLFQKQLESDIHKKEIEALNTENKLQQAEANRNEIALRQQRTIIYSVSGGGLLIASLLIIAVKAYRQKKRDRDFIEKQKLEVEEQKQQVEHKQKEILDSIHYARRIQSSLLPSEKRIEKSMRKISRNKNDLP